MPGNDLDGQWRIQAKVLMGRSRPVPEGGL
jgi:hypothetical protein